MSEFEQKAVEERKPFVVEVDPIEFTPDEEGKYVTSNELCSLTNGIFREIFSDWYGSKFEVSGGIPMISLHFSHMEKTDGVTLATERLSAKQVGNSTIDKTRSRDNLLVNGDKYTLTEDGKDFIKKLLIPRVFNSGKPNWGNIVSATVDATTQSMYTTVNAQQLTKVTCIDPRRICALLWGDKDESGALDYGITILKDLSITPMTIPGAQIPSNYVLRIQRAHTATIAKTYEKFGIGAFGSSIIR